MTHHHSTWHPVALAVIVLATLQPASAQAAQSRTFTLDVVELLENKKDVAGDPVHAVERNGLGYHFASAENKGKFLSQPERFEIQMGGACARMGPLSGAGRCDIYTVHGDRLYIFAHTKCRETFLKAPERLLEVNSAAPSAGDSEAKTRGQELLEFALAAHGGAARIDAVTSTLQVFEESSTHDGKEYRHRESFWIAFPDRFRHESCWNDACSGFVAAGGRGATLDAGRLEHALADSQVRALERLAQRNLLTIFKSRKNPDFVALETTMPGTDQATRALQVYVAGTTQHLTIDARSGRVTRLSYTGPGGDYGFIGTLVRTYQSYETVDGVTLPTSWTTSFDGVESESGPTRLSKVAIDPELAPDLFTLPAAR